jgi:GWxTD domain-containing protein
MREVIPNASALFGEGAPELYYYFEAYHLAQNLSGRKYKTLCRIQTAEGKTVEGMGSAYRTKMKRFDSSVEMGMLNVAQLPSGKYRLVYGIADSAETLLASREKVFFVYNPAVAANGVHGESEMSMSSAAGPLNALEEKALDDEFARMQYLATPNEKKFYKNLSNSEAKREFIFSLWKAAPANDGLTPLAYRQQYLARAQHAEGLYKSPNRPGWKTDRGRVFIIYGPPNNIERFPSSTTTLPYEIWTYHSLKGQGGVMFIFADRTGFSNYEQIHSDLQGELQDPNWQQLITRGSSGENRMIGVQ